ncbi:MAG: dephospho-CoA kinase [Dehalococcoidia bacterium]|nr:dephospho-CoA kinase [Dehalococcoidia bacterium]
MITIGLTGGIGTGKSEVGRILQGLGASFIDADKLGHEAYVPNTEGWKKVVAAFGKDILKPDNEIDRAKLGAIVFNKPEAMKKLTDIVWPLIFGMIDERRAAMAKQGVKVGVLEAAVLIEAGWHTRVDEVWVTTANESTIIERLRTRNGLSKEAALARIHAQMPSAERVKHADVILENNGDLEALRQRVYNAWRTRIQNRIGDHVLS